MQHIGPDGQPVSYGNYGDMLGQHPGTDYKPYGGYNSLHDFPGKREYAPYGAGNSTASGDLNDPARNQDYGLYGGRPGSPDSQASNLQHLSLDGSRRNYDSYSSPHHGTNYQDYDPYTRTRDYAPYPPSRQDHIPPHSGHNTDYRNYGSLPRNPDRARTPPSPGGSGFESPLPQRAVPQVAVGASGGVPSGLSVVPEDYNHMPYQGYEDMELPHRPPLPTSEHLQDVYGTTPSPSGERYDVRWRDPDLPEVIEFLGHPNHVIKANAAAYLQHLCYMDDQMKQKTRSLGGIPPLIRLLNHDIPEVHRNACGALRNLSYGRQNDENKRAIKNAGGIPSLVRVLRKTPDNEVRELVTGVLWNLSSCEDIKKPIIDDGLTVLVVNVIIPHSGWDRNIDTSENHKPPEIYWSTVFRNASGVLRNVSSAGEYARRKLRECEGLVDALLYLVKAAIGKSDIDNKSVENCVCVLRNLSYRCQEVDDPHYDRHELPSQPNRATAPTKVGDNLGCFGASKKKKEPPPAPEREPATARASPRPRTEPVKGMELLWQPEVVQIYLSLLSDCSNPETLEAAAGAIQNLAACYWQPSIDIRAAVRKEKGLPILVELLRMEVDRVVCAVATALRNLAIDQRNKELIGKYAMRDLVQKLPSESQQHDTGTSDETIAAVLATLNEVVKKNAEFARAMLEAGGVDRLMHICRARGKFSARVVKFASQVLFNMWQHQELREVYKKHGWKESNFVTRTMAARGTSPSNVNSTLNRPMSSQGGTKYEDRTIRRGQDLNSSGLHGRQSDGKQPIKAEEVPLLDMGYPTGAPGSMQPQSPVMEQGPQPPSHRPPVGGVQVFPHGITKPAEPVYAQVNRDKKLKNRGSDNHHGGGVGSEPWDSAHSAMLDSNNPDGHPAGDSWV